MKIAQELSKNLLIVICQDTVITVFNVFGDTMAYQDRQL